MPFGGSVRLEIFVHCILLRGKKNKKWKRTAGTNVITAKIEDGKIKIAKEGSRCGIPVITSTFGGTLSSPYLHKHQLSRPPPSSFVWFSLFSSLSLKTPPCVRRRRVWKVSLFLLLRWREGGGRGGLGGGRPCRRNRREGLDRGGRWGGALRPRSWRSWSPSGIWFQPAGTAAWRRPLNRPRTGCSRRRRTTSSGWGPRWSFSTGWFSSTALNLILRTPTAFQVLCYSVVASAQWQDSHLSSWILLKRKKRIDFYTRVRSHVDSSMISTDQLL